MGMTRLFLLFLLSLGVAGIARADEPQVDYQALATGAGVLVAPIPFVGNGLDYSHGEELTGWSYMGTDILDRIFPKEIRFMAPILVGLFDLGWITAKNDKGDEPLREFACGGIGVLGRVVVDFKF
jgi:hypothetical protein